MRDFQIPGRSAVQGRDGMVATSSALASFEAASVLKSGGNAVDAAVTAAALLGVCEPHMTGIGGDCFALLSLPDGTVKGLNGSGCASHNADAQWLQKAGLDEITGDNIHAVTVPGAIDAWDRLLKDFGTISLGDALAPAVRHARDGIAISERTASDWAGQVELLNSDAGSKKHLLAKERAPVAGEVFQFPALAETLEKIAFEGRDAFYHGEFAEEMVALVNGQGGLLDLEDFASTTSDEVEPLATGFCGREILELPPNGQGITALIALNILKQFDLSEFAVNSAERWHLQIEAMKKATVLQHRYVADPSFMDVAPEALLDEDYAKQMAGQIDLSQADPDPAANMLQPGSDTVYLCVVDRDRLAVSLINSVYESFGSRRTTLKSGITLQNRGACFVADPAHPNCIGPRKRPRHTIIPGLIRKGERTEAVFGVMGGAYQPMGHTSVLVNRYIYGMNPQEALDFPRAFHKDGVVEAERGFETETLSELAARGHKIETAPSPWGGGQFIHIDHTEGSLTAGSDPRKDGMAIGF